MKLVQSFLLAFTICLCLSSAATGQQVSGVDGFVGHGIAKISGGDMPGARQSAVADAQLKAVVDGALSLIPSAAAAPHCARLFSRFAENPERFIQSFRINSEHALPDHYQVSLQASLDMEGVRQELAAMGLIKQPAAASNVLLIMAAERGLDAEQDSYWWSPEAPGAAGSFPLQQALESAFADSQTRVLSPFDPPLRELFGPVGQQPDPDAAAVAQIARQTTDAQTVMLVRASLKRVAGTGLSSLHNVQCDIAARALDVRRQEVVAQSVTCGLGVHVDEAEAARDAMQKASRQLADQVTERLYQQLRQVREYVFKLRFSKPATDADARDCIAAFKQVLPGLEPGDITAEDATRWTARVFSPAESAAVLERMFGAGVAGYITKITSVQDNVISIRVTPIKKR